MSNLTILETTTKTGIRNATRYEENPFLDRLTIKTRGKKVTVARGARLVDTDTGEIEGITEIAQVIEVEQEEFIKLYTRDLAIWFDLKKTGLRVFGALMLAIQENAIGRDLVYFDHTGKNSIAFGLSKNTFYRGVEELLEKGFIARHKSAGWYFINPTMFFNGDRARFVKEYRRPKSKKSEVKSLTADLFLPSSSSQT
jgi:hypothetical protein